MSKHLMNGMRLLYLDQCAASRLLASPSNQVWAEFRDAILLGCSRRRFLCPSSLEHLVETSSMTDRSAYELDEVLRTLSSGWSFALDPRLIARQIFCAVKDTRMTKSQILQKKQWRPLNHAGALDYLRGLKSEVDKYNSWLMEGVNEMNALCQNGKHCSRQTQELLVKLDENLRKEELLKAIDVAIARGRAEIFPNDYDKKCRDLPSTIIYTLVKEHGFRIDSLLKFRGKLVTEGIKFIPMLWIKCRLRAFQFARRENIEPRDQYDVTRIASVLPYADILITDGGKAQAIRELHLDKLFNTEVYSMKIKELPNLVERLKSIALE